MLKAIPSRIHAIIAAAGTGTRMQRQGGKQCINLAGKTVIRRSCEAFEAHDALRSYLVLAHPAELRAMQDELADLQATGKLIAVIPGGLSRQESCLLGLRFYQRWLLAYPKHYRELMLIHDGARCLLSQALLERVCAKLLEGRCGVAPAMPVTDTIRVLNAEKLVLQTPDRSKLLAMQTPQGADFPVLMAAAEEAYRQGLKIRDDLTALEHIGYPIRFVPGEASNMKLTHPEDLALASFYLSQQKA